MSVHLVDVNIYEVPRIVRVEVDHVLLHGFLMTITHGNIIVNVATLSPPPPSSDTTHTATL